MGPFKRRNDISIDWDSISACFTIRFNLIRTTPPIINVSEYIVNSPNQHSPPFYVQRNLLIKFVFTHKKIEKKLKKIEKN